MLKKRNPAASMGVDDALRRVEMPPIGATELAEWFDTQGASLLLYARHWLDRTAAEDVLQEVFIKLAAMEERPANVRAWLITCVRNASLDALRGKRRQAARDRSAGEERLFARTAHGGDAALDAQDVQRALAGLGDIEREIIVLRIWNGATFEEIAGIVHLPLSTVYARYKSGLSEMRTLWEAPCKRS